MLNKKLAIAALLAVALAQDDAVPDAGADAGAGGEDAGAGGEDAGAGGEDAGAGGEDAGAGGEDAGAGDADAGAGDADAGAGDADAGDDGADAGGDADKEDDGSVPEGTRKDWRTGDQDPDVALADGDEIFCDHGEDALWEAARDHYNKLKAALETAKGAVDTLDERASTGFAALTTAFETAETLENAHRNDNAAILTAYDTASDAVAELVAASTGDDATDAKQTLLDTETAKTTAKEDAVDDQRARVETLVLAKATQDAQAAAWGERVTAAEAEKTTKDDLQTAATTAVAEAKEQGTTRSWLLETLNLIDASQFVDDCQTVVGGDQQPYCQYSEDSAIDYTTTSTWAWPANCDTDAGAACKILGLKNVAEPSLWKANSEVLGVSTAGSRSGLYAALDTADFLAEQSGTAALETTAAADFLAWYKMLLPSVVMEAACWTGPAAANFVVGDKLTSCGIADVSGSNFSEYNPIMQGATTEGTQAYYKTQAAALKTTYDTSEGALQTGITAKALAQTNVWYGEWIQAALETQLRAVGDTAEKANIIALAVCDANGANTNGTGGNEAAVAYPAAGYNCNTTSGAASWETTTIGTAEAAETLATSVAAAYAKNVATATEWKRIADDDAAKADADLTRASTLLGDLVEDIAPAARAEIEARNALAEAVSEQAARVLATEKLGECQSQYVADTNNGSLECILDADAAAGSDPATGARAVFQAAKVARDSVLEQQAFHTARMEWARDNLAPVKAQYNALVAKRDNLQDEFDMAEAALAMAKTQCKVAAFHMAQDALTEATLVANARADKAAEVKKEYEGMAAMPTDGSVGTLCNYAKPVEGEAQAPRQECAEGEPGKPLCCGAAQAFLKDGTKLSIETCQLATATTYRYYPALPVDAVVQPTPQTWRFQCISAAQKLAAAATAALAAGYMMA